MTDTTNGNTSEPSQRKSMPEKISSSMSIGAVAAMFLAGPETLPAELESNLSLSDAVLGCLGAACLFGLPAGLFLALRDRSKNVTSAWSAVWSVPGGIFSGAMVLALLIYGLSEINSFSAFAREKLGPGPENSGLSELASMLAGSFWGLALMLLYTSAETLKSKLEPSPPEPGAGFVAPVNAASSAVEGHAAADNHSELVSIPVQPAESQKADTSPTRSWWGLAGIFPFLVAFLIWMAGITRSYNIALELCFGLMVGIPLLLLLSYAVPLLSGNEKYMIRNWVLIVVVAVFGVMWALSYWLDISILPGSTKTEPPSIDLFILGVCGFNHLKERRARSARLQAGSLVTERT